MSGKNKEALFEAANNLKEKAHSKDEVNFRVIITGKGGAGKTTTTAILAHLFAEDNYNVLAIDEDPQMNLPYALGMDFEKAKNIVPVSKNFDYIEEKTGARPGTSWGLFLNLTPDISDVVDKFGVKITDNINLLVMGTVVQAATGCLCPENALLDAIVKYISLRKNEIILMDTQAGVEHFGRALSKGFKHCVIVSDATFNALDVANHTANLARQIGIKHIYLAINRVRSQKDIEKVESRIEDKGKFDRIFYIPYNEKVIEYEPSVVGLIKENGDFMQVYKQIKEVLKNNL